MSFATESDWHCPMVAGTDQRAMDGVGRGVAGLDA